MVNFPAISGPARSQRAIARRSLFDGLAGIFALVRVWRSRHHQRRALGELSDWQLRDIGIERDAARRESRKPCWRP